ncbi:MAG: hypothetical protein IH897_11770, partial [Planctomycetes bacterium]|nr:hypothetical protein [Planctomycetota bacterium]
MGQNRLFATPSSPVTKVYSFDLDNLASPNGGNLNGILWGLTDFPFNPDHHVNIKLNGVQVEDKIFNGLTLIDLNADLNKLGVTLLESSNQLEINLPAETAASFDIVDIDSFTVSFERNFIANDGKLVYSD